jgi:hypothetical protein
MLSEKSCSQYKIHLAFKSVSWRLKNKEIFHTVRSVYDGKKKCLRTYLVAECARIYRVIKNDSRGFNNLSYTIHLR